MCSLVGGRSNVVPFVRSVIKLGPPFAFVLNMRKGSWTFFRLPGRREAIFLAQLLLWFNMLFSYVGGCKTILIAPVNLGMVEFLPSFS